MLECVQALVETLDLKCTEGDGSAVVDMYAILSNLTTVGYVISSSICSTWTKEAGCNGCDLFWGFF